MAKKTTKKTTRKKAAKSTAARKKTARKKVSKKAVSKKKAAEKTTKRKVAKKKAAKKSTSKKRSPKKTTKKKVTRKRTGSTAAGKRNGKAAHAAPPPAPPPGGTRPIGWHTPGEDDEQTNGIPLTDAQLRRVKSGLSRKDLNFFRSLLLEKRAELVGDVTHMEAVRNDAGDGNLSHMPLHMADIGSDNFEQEFALGLMESEKRLLGEIDDALRRIAGKTYGVCVQSGVPIDRARLEIKPWAKYSIDVARERERRGL